MVEDLTKIFSDEVFLKHNFEGEDELINLVVFNNKRYIVTIKEENE